MPNQRVIEVENINDVRVVVKRPEMLTCRYRSDGNGGVARKIFNHPEDVPANEGWVDSPAKVEHGRSEQPAAAPVSSAEASPASAAAESAPAGGEGGAAPVKNKGGRPRKDAGQAA